MLRVIRAVRPQYVFVENSKELIWNGLDTVLEGLDASGYDAEWGVLGASDVGAPHIRKRCWILGKNTKIVWQAANVANAHFQSRQTGRGIETICHETFIEDWQKRQTDKTFGSSWWESEPGVVRVVDELPHRLVRLKALGNAQVPLCAAAAWKILYERINEQ
jgi:DNA (cytosine-5)-methyltransferase 1